MDTMKAIATGQSNRGKEMMIFDWDKAAELIRERKPETASAGLSGAWGLTGGEIYRSGEIVDDEYTFLGSTWATPLLEMDGAETECYRMQSETPDWDENTKWPKTALFILANNLAQRAGD